MSDVLKLKGWVLVITYRISFAYTTKRNNQKQRTVEIKATNEDDARSWFNVWWQTEGERKGFRAYSNVTILECVEVDRQLLEV